MTIFSPVVVKEEAYGRLETPEEWLSDLHGWKNALVALSDMANEQFQALNADDSAARVTLHNPQEWREMRSNFAERRVAIGHFKRKLESRLRHVNGLIREQGQRAHEESFSGKWRKLCLWLLVDMDVHGPEEFLDAPFELQDTLKFAFKLLAEGKQ